MKGKSKLKILIVVIVMALCSGFVYKGAISPKLYDKYLNTGIKYLMDGEYEEAILAFDKAIKIEAKSTEARVYQAKAYIGNNQVDKAVEVLQEAQNIDKTNEELVKEIIEILNEVNADAAYKVLDKYVNTVGVENVSSEIKNMYNSANEIPNEPKANPSPGKYAKPISVKLELEEIKLGHNYYYTVDGSQPNKGSDKYSGKIEINKTTTIKVVGYNQKGESTELITLDYIIDESILEKVEQSITEAETLINETKVGNEVGNISQSQKNKLQSSIDEAKKTLNKDLIKYNNVSNIKIKVESAIREFKNNIIKPTDKSKLKSAINNAENLYNNSKEGTSAGQYKSGSKSVFLNAINNAKKIYENKMSKQYEIDKEVTNLNNAINSFKNKKVKLGKKVLTSNEVSVYKERIYEYLGRPQGIRIEYDYDIAQIYPNIHNNYHTFTIYDEYGIINEDIVVIDIATDKIYSCNPLGNIY